MMGRVSDVPLSGDPASRYLPWTVGLLVFLATLAFAAGMFLSSVGETWRQNLSGTLTVQIPAPETGDRTARVAAAVELLLATPVTRCDEVAWSLGGISMAGYNGIVSLAAALVLAIALTASKGRARR